MSAKTENTNRKNKNLSPMYWDQLWKSGDSYFHNPVPHGDLVKHEKLLLPEPGSVFIPLCGKAVDMKYLADKGHKVTGLEFSETGILDFFKEQSLSYKRSQHPTLPFDVFKAEGADIVIYKGNIFDACVDLLGKFDAVWDRGSYVAINVADQKKYRELMVTLLKSNAVWLLNCFEYNAMKYGGAPHCMMEDDIRLAFENQFVVTKLSWYSYNPNSFNLNKMTSVIYSIKFRQQS